MDDKKVIFRPAAENDLNRIALYIAQQSSVGIAQRYAHRIHAACHRLAYFANRGRPRDDILPGLRTIAFERRVTIAYRVLDTHVEILSIVYGGRDFGSELRDP